MRSGSWAGDARQQPGRYGGDDQQPSSTPLVGGGRSRVQATVPSPTGGSPTRPSMHKRGCEVADVRCNVKDLPPFSLPGFPWAGILPFDVDKSRGTMRTAKISSVFIHDGSRLTDGTFLRSGDELIAVGDENVQHETRVTTLRILAEACGRARRHGDGTIALSLRRPLSRSDSASRSRGTSPHPTGPNEGLRLRSAPRPRAVGSSLAESTGRSSAARSQLVTPVRLPAARRYDAGSRSVSPTKTHRETSRAQDGGLAKLSMRLQEAAPAGKPPPAPPASLKHATNPGPSPPRAKQPLSATDAPGYAPVVVVTFLAVVTAVLAVALGTEQLRPPGFDRLFDSVNSAEAWASSSAASVAGAVGGAAPRAASIGLVAALVAGPWLRRPRVAGMALAFAAAGGAGLALVALSCDRGACEVAGTALRSGGESLFLSLDEWAGWGMAEAAHMVGLGEAECRVGSGYLPAIALQGCLASAAVVLVGAAIARAVHAAHAAMGV